MAAAEQTEKAEHLRLSIVPDSRADQLARQRTSPDQKRAHPNISFCEYMQLTPDPPT